VAGWLSGRRVPTERPAIPLRGYKLAHPMVSADGERGGFSGVTIGRTSVYEAVADAECAQGGRHSCPSRWCDCGFYCVNTLDDARALACDPDYRYAVLLEIAASGRFIRYEKGLRYARQRVVSVRVGRCGCGRPARVFVESDAGTVGWRRMAAVCPSCAAPRPGISLGRFAELLGGPPVIADETNLAGAGAPTSVAAAPALDDVDREALVPLLSAEVSLLQARLDDVQRQLERLTQKP
jgi:hypothetical protein